MGGGSTTNSSNIQRLFATYSTSFMHLRPIHRIFFIYIYIYIYIYIHIYIYIFVYTNNHGRKHVPKRCFDFNLKGNLRFLLLYCSALPSIRFSNIRVRARTRAHTPTHTQNSTTNIRVPPNHLLDTVPCRNLEFSSMCGQW